MGPGGESAMLAALLLFAEQEAEKAAPSGPPSSGLQFAVLALVGLAAFWLLVLRPQKQHQDRQRHNLLLQSKKNDQVMINDFVYGQIVSMSEKDDEVVIRLDDNVKLRFVKKAITRNLTMEERLTAEQDAAKAKTPAAAADKVAPKKEGTA